MPAAGLAREAADAATALTPNKPRFVAGSLGPTTKTASISPDVNDPGARNVTWDQLVAAYTTAARGLVIGGVDILLIETIFDTLNGKAAIFAVDSLFEELGTRLPVIVSATIVDQSGRNLSGQTVGALWNSMRHARPLAFGLNCSLGAEMLRPYVAELARIADVPVVTYPNAGLPNAFGGYDEQPPETSAQLGRLAREGALNLVGSCCGTTPDHTRAIVAAVEGLQPRRIPQVEPATRLAGLEPLDIRADSLFVNVGERTNVTGSRAFARLIKEERYDEAVAIARQQVDNGAQMIDINMDEALLDSQAAMARFLNLIASEPDIAKVPVMIDSSRWDVIEEGLKHMQGRPVVNSRFAQGGRAGVPAPGPACPAVWRGGDRHGLRRAGPGGHGRSKGRDCPPRTRVADRASGLRPDRRDRRSEHLRDRHGHRRARRLRECLPRRHAAPEEGAAHLAGQWRRLERVVRLPRQ